MKKRESGGLQQKSLHDFFKRKLSINEEKDSRKRLRVKIELEYEKCQEIRIENLKINFPGTFSPYPSQMLIMEKNIISFNNGTHILIESPTGSGKTMALLSSTIGWLKNYKIKRQISLQNCRKHSFSKENEVKNELPSEESDNRKKIKLEDSIKEENVIVQTKDEIKNENEDNGPPGCTCLKKIQVYYATRTHKQIAQVIKEYKRLPYGYKKEIRHTILSSRDHTCINEDIKDLNNDITSKCKEITSKKGLKCKYKDNLNKINGIKTEILRDQLKEKSSQVWDLEEIVNFSKDKSFCPYFTTSAVLRNDSDIIFCPFNYLVDPIIRGNSEMTLDNTIVIMDEAHNMEDVCRSSSSFDFTEKEMIHSLNNVYLKKYSLTKRLEELEKTGVNKYDFLDENAIKYRILSDYLTNLVILFEFMDKLVKWFVSFSKEVLNIKEKDDKQFKVFNTTEIMKSFIAHDLICYINNPTKLFYLKNVWLSCLSSGEDENDESKMNESLRSDMLDEFRLNGLSIVCIEKFIYFAFYMNKKPVAYRLYYSIEKSDRSFDIFEYYDGYQISKFSDSSYIYKEMVNMIKEESIKNEKVKKNFIAGSVYEEIKRNTIVKMDLWCLDPSICFLDAFQTAHSIVLASGTLSPIDTFTSELGMNFKCIVQGEQVIPKEQIFASVVGVGPSDREIICTQKEINQGEKNNSNSILLEIAHLIVDVCEKVEKGVLVFFPSYNMINQVYDKLNSSKLMSKLKSYKVVLQEPRKSNVLDTIMKEFEDAVKNPKSISKTCTGGVMFAVYRGKISEGIDFPDDLARCVISIGIPYPSIVDQQVIEKKLYNSKFCKVKNLLNGNEWYKIQAFRALNQALGRCLRHRDDWGLIILVDKRIYDMVETNSIDKNKISKWVVDNIKSYGSYKSFQNEVVKFVKKRKKSFVIHNNDNIL
uniref:Helicase ATP-binding domain-containing protein n=1 Tax=Parastrongyloides trichosuri TaxID=131310 RepID=A0A0N5A1A4_PARTI